MMFTKVSVQRDETTTIVIHVGAWEIPVLELKHGAERLTVHERVNFEGRDWPENAGSEMQRLSQLYGMTGAGDNSPSFAEQAYGPGSAGVRALAAAIQAEKEASEAAAPEAATPSIVEDLVGTATA